MFRFEFRDAAILYSVLEQSCGIIMISGLLCVRYDDIFD